MACFNSINVNIFIWSLFMCCFRIPCAISCHLVRSILRSWGNFCVHFGRNKSIRDLGLMLALGYTCILNLFYNENPNVSKKEKNSLGVIWRVICCFPRRTPTRNHCITFLLIAASFFFFFNITISFTHWLLLPTFHPPALSLTPCPSYTLGYYGEILSLQLRAFLI